MLRSLIVSLSRFSILGVLILSISSCQNPLSETGYSTTDLNVVSFSYKDAYTRGLVRNYMSIAPTNFDDKGFPPNCTISPALPQGLSISSPDCVISGTPVALMPPTIYTVTALSRAGMSQANVSISVVSSAPMVTYPSHTVSRMMAQILINPVSLYDNGSPITNCTVSPALLTGLTLDPSTCVISGATPDYLLYRLYTVKVTNAIGTSESTFSLSVAAPPLMSFNGISGAGQISLPFRAQPSVFNTRGEPVTSCTTTPALPAGLSINQSTCVISGTPTEVISGTYTVTATNGAGSTNSSILINITPYPPLVTYSMGGFIGYISVPFVATPNLYEINGAPITSCTISPTLPNGLSIDPITCVVSGIPTVSIPQGNYTITVTNSAGVGYGTLPMMISPSVPVLSYAGVSGTGSFGSYLSITPSTLINNGAWITSCTISPALPSGLWMDNYTCSIFGTASQVIPLTTFTVSAANSAGVTTAQIPISIAPTPPNLSYEGAVGKTGFAQSPRTIIPRTFNYGGVSLTNCTISPALPTGLSISPTNCVISGTALYESTTTTYTVTATNVAGTGTATLDISVSPIPPTLSYATSAGKNGLAQNAMSITPSALNQGGTSITNCTITPALPSGLSIDTTTCVISGTPPSESPSTTYTVTIHNSAGTGTASVALKVDPIPPTLSYAGATGTVGSRGVGMSVTPTALNQGGTTITNCTTSPALPSGLSINTATCVISGTPTVMSPSTNYLVTIHNSAGTGTSTVNLTVNGTLSFTEDDPSVSVPVLITNLSSASSCSQIGVSSSLLVSSSASGTYPNCSVAVTPLLNKNGSGSLVFTVNDNAQAVTSLSFSISAVNDSPVIPVITAQSTNEDTPKSVSYSFSDVDSAPDCTSSITVTSSNTTLLPNSSITKSGTAPNCSLSLSPALNEYGSTNVTVVVTDGSLTDTKTFTLTVNPVNDAPVLGSISNTSTSEDTPVSVSYSYVDVDSTLSCTSSMTVTSSNTTLLPNANITKSGTAPNCSLSLSPALNQNGTSTITVVISDGELTDTKSFSLTVNAVNDAPVLAAISNTSTNEDTPTSVSYSFSDVDSTPNCTSSITVTSSNTTLVPNANVTKSGTAPNCSLSLSPALNEYGSTNVTVVVSDGSLTDTKTFTLTVNPINDAPVLAAISAQSTNEDTALSVSYSFVDVDSTPNCTSSMTVMSSNTTLVPNANITKSGTAPNCSLSLSPALNQNGTSTITVAVSDGALTDTKTFNLTVNALNDAPVLAAISNTSTNEDTATSVSYSFSDVDSSPNCTSSITVTSSNTTLVPNANITKSGTAPNCGLSISPALNQNGTSIITVVVSDGTLSDSKTFTLTVNSVDDAPVASSVSGTLTEDTSGQVTLSYSDIESNQATTCTLSSVSNLTGSCACTSGTCQATVTGTSNFNGSASFSYTVTANGLTSNAASASVSISAVDDAPVASNVSGTLTEDTSGQITLSYSDVESHQAATCTLTSPSNLTGTCACTTGTCRATVTGTSNFNGSASFSFTVTANGLTSNAASATVSVTAVDDAPVASNVSATINEDVATQVTLSYSDIEGNQATACTLSSPSNLTGTCACTSGTCRATVTGTSNFNGSASFNYTVTANGLTSNTAAAAITVSAVDDAPVASNVSATINEDVATSVTLSYSDVESHQATTCTLSSPSNLTGTCACASGTCQATVTGTSNYNGAASFNYTVTANGLTSTAASAAVTVSAVDDAPVASNVSGALTEDIQGPISLSYTDVEGHVATACSLTFPTLSSLTGTCACSLGNCQASITGSSNFNGSASFSYTVTANGLTSNSASASVSVSAVNDAPVLAAISAQSTNEDTAKSVSYSFSDVDSTPDCTSSITVTSSNTTLLPNANITKSGTAPNCSLSISPALNQNGTSTITVVVSDGALSDTKTFTLTVNAVDDAPVASNVSGTLTEDTSGQVTLSYSDVESHQATTCTLSSLSNLTGSCACTSGTCQATVTGTSNFNGSASFSYTVTANGLTSNAASATVSISAVDDAPVASNVSATINEDVATQVTLSYSDVESHQAATCTLSSPSNLTGTCACTTGTCQATVTGTLNFNGSASFSYTVTANGLTSNTSSASVSISAVDDAPVTSNVSATINEDVATQVTLSYSDVESHQAATCTLSSPLNLTGTCACTTGTCRATVTGTSNFNGAASFSYTVTANGLTSNAASATVSVSAVDDAPVASNVSGTITEDVSGQINLSYTDVESHQATTCTLSSLSNITGSCSCTTGTCRATVTGTSNFNGSASFNYTVTANGLTSNTAAATITVSAVDDAPVASNVSATINEDVATQVILSYSDVDAHQAATCTLSSPSNLTGTCACTSGTCQATVTGTSNYNGAASFSYTVTANGLTSNTASASITISAVNDTPVVSSIGTQTTNEDTSKVVSFTISDVESTLNCSSSVSVTSSSPVSSVTKGGTAPNCTLTVVPIANLNGSSSIGVTVTDGSLSASTSFTFTVTPVDDAPVASNVSGTISEDVAGSITLSYTDADSDKAATCVLSSLSNLTGTCSCNASTGVCTASVTGTSNYNGVASFSYTVTANSVVSNSATASVTISAVNDAPVLSAISAQTTTENIAKSVTLSVSDIDNSITCTSFISATSSNTTLLPNTNIVRGGTAPGCTLTMTPATSQTGTATVTVTASDGSLSSTQSFVLTVNPNIVTISQFSGYRGWSNGTFARTCYEYLNPTGIYQYSGSTGNSTYRIDPDGAGAVSPLDVTCDMANGGWTTISSMRTDAIASTSDSGELVTSNVAAFNAIAALSNLQKITYTSTYASGSTTVPGTCQKGIYTSNSHNIYVYTQNGSQCCLAYWWGNPTTWYCPVSGTYCVTSYSSNEGFRSLPTEYGMYPTASLSYVRLNNAAAGGWDPYCYTPEGTATTCTYNGVDFKTSSGVVVNSIDSAATSNNTISFGITSGSPVRKFTTKSSCSSGGTNGISGTLTMNASTSFGYTPNVIIVDNGSYKAWSNGTVATSCAEYRNPTSSTYQYSGSIGDGIYRIDVDGSGALTPFDVKCDMTSDGGGWTVLIAHDGTYQTTTSILSNYATFGSISSGIQFNATYGVFWNSSTWGRNANNTLIFSKVVPGNQVRITFTGVYGNNGLGGLVLYSNDGTAVFNFNDGMAESNYGQALIINNSHSLFPLNATGGGSSLTDLYNEVRAFTITSPLKEISNYYYPGYTNNQRYIRELKVRTGNAASVTLVNNGSYRSLSNGTFARSCYEYRYPTGFYSYSGSTGDGIYRIDPDGSGATAPLDVFCDMTTSGGGWTLLISQKNGSWFTQSNVLSYDTGNPNSNSALYSILGMVDTIPNSKIYMYKNYESATTFKYTITSQSVSAITNSGNTVPGFSLIETTESQISYLNGYGLVQHAWGTAKYGSNVTSWWWSLGQFQTYSSSCPLVTNVHNCSHYQYSFWMK